MSRVFLVRAVMALMVGAMTIHGIVPGPQVMTKNASLFWGMIASMWIGNLMLLIINLPMIGMWVKLLTVPYRFLAPAILLFCCIGAYSLQNSTFHVMQVAIFGILGYIFVRLGCEGAPFLLGLVLGVPLVLSVVALFMVFDASHVYAVEMPPVALALMCPVLVHLVGFVLGVRRVVLDWKPEWLLDRRVGIESLEVDGVDGRAETDLDPVEPVGRAGRAVPDPDPVPGPDQARRHAAAQDRGRDRRRHHLHCGRADPAGAGRLAVLHRFPGADQSGGPGHPGPGHRGRADERHLDPPLLHRGAQRGAGAARLTAGSAARAGRSGQHHADPAGCGID